MTINELMVVRKSVREKVTDLKRVRASFSRLNTYFSKQDSVEEPRYDVKAVDRKITELQDFLLIADSKLKMTNAITQVDITVDIDKLLEPLE